MPPQQVWFQLLWLFVTAACLLAIDWKYQAFTTNVCLLIAACLFAYFGREIFLPN